MTGLSIWALAGRVVLALVHVWIPSGRHLYEKGSPEEGEMRKRSGFIFAVVLIGGGVAGVSMEDSHHNACSSSLGPFGSLSGDLARHCTLDNTLFFVAAVAALVGLALVVAALVIRS